MRFNIITLFPEFFSSPLEVGLMGRARESALVDFVFFNPRDYSLDKHHKVDDRPFGGGPGMVMLLEPLVRCLRDVSGCFSAAERPLATVPLSLTVPSTAPLGVEERAGRKLGKILFLTPAGQPFTQALAQQLAQEEALTLICGRYEGVDARLGELFELCPVSLGDFVLNGGESAALAVVESVARLLPGFMGHNESGLEESFSNGLLEYPHYTRPEVFEDSATRLSVPEVLRGGNHAAIAQWRRQESLFKTLEVRPELLPETFLSAEEFEILGARPRLKRGRNLHCVLVHHPVTGKDGKSCVVSLTNLDIHDIARSSCTYGLGGGVGGGIADEVGGFYISTPLVDQRRLLDEIIEYWTQGAGAISNPDRAVALSLVHGVETVEEAVEHLRQRTGQEPLLIGTSARIPSAKSGRRGKKRRYPEQISFKKTADLLLEHPVLLVFGTGHGLYPELLEKFHYMLPPVRPTGYNHLSVRSAVAIILDRILGDWL